MTPQAEALRKALNLTPRAAEWTAFAALHSGVFTRQQLRAWLPGDEENTRSGASKIVAALRRLGVADENELAGIGPVVHIHGKEVYRVLGETDNRNRRSAERPLTLARLLGLDYVLDRPDEAWLPTERAKLEACDALGIERRRLPAKRYEPQGPTAPGLGVTRWFVEKHPLAIDPAGKRAVLCCVSAAERTCTGLESWLRSYGPLIDQLAARGFALRLVHVVENARTVDEARQTLQRFAGGRRTAEEQYKRDEAELERIKAAIRAATPEALASIGGMQGARRVRLEIEARRAARPACDGRSIVVEVWMSARLYDRPETL